MKIPPRRPAGAVNRCSCSITARRDFCHRIVAGWLALAAACLAAGCSGSQKSPAVKVSDQQMTPVHIAELNDRVKGLFVRACYDCHSDQSSASLYMALAPSYWFSGSARKKLNFSDWERYDARRKNAELKLIAKTVKDGSMPPRDYVLVDPEAGLTADEKDAVVEWVAEQIALPAH